MELPWSMGNAKLSRKRLGALDRKLPSNLEFKAPKASSPD